ncbi:MAG: hypothetical protein K9G49_01095 [Taibaiella sp.]|nr:hypothetical protein [Taibaiella sp.]
MSTFKERLFTNWHMIRIIRGGIGLAILIMAFQSKDWMLALFSSFFLYQAITDTGCCGTQGCAPAAKPTKPGITIDTPIEYEEIK